MAPGTVEYVAVVSKVALTLPKTAIARIDRVENGKILVPYLDCLKAAKDNHGGEFDKLLMRKLLFHGTDVHSVEASAFP